MRYSAAEFSSISVLFMKVFYLNRMKRFLLFFFLVLILGAAAFFIMNRQSFTRLGMAMSMFSEEKIHSNFISVYKYFNISKIPPAADPYIIPKGSSLALPKYTYKGKEYTAEDYFNGVNTTAFTVIKNDTIRYERYWKQHTDTTRHISWSVAKSYLAVLMGEAIEDGHIDSVNDPIDKYLPNLKGSGYEGVSLKDILQMASGVKYNEDYTDFFSDINRWGRAYAWGASQLKFAESLEREKEPGTDFLYVSINTQVLSMAITAATGRSLADYMYEKIWNPLGCTTEAYWACDNSGEEISLGGLNATLMDFARFGLMLADEGKNHKGETIISPEWFKEATSASEPYLKTVSEGYGYGYQFWLPKDEGYGREYMCRGHSQQYIYANASTQTVVALNSANWRYSSEPDIFCEAEMILAFCREISKM